METEVEFKSGLFRPFLPEASQVNPGRYGAELAFWLCRNLSDRGIVTSYPQHEDWGWLLCYQTQEGEEFHICCGNMDGGPEGKVLDDEWMCFVVPLARGWFGRKKPSIDKARPLLDMIKQILHEEPEITDIKWYSGKAE